MSKPLVQLLLLLGSSTRPSDLERSNMSEHSQITLTLRRFKLHISVAVFAVLLSANGHQHHESTSHD